LNYFNYRSLRHYTAAMLRLPCLIASLLGAISLTACGGGSSTPPSPTPVTVDTSAITPLDPGSALPAQWQRRATFMQVFVRSYRDSNGDGIGDLKGVTQSLDYLQSLGIGGIWLMPISPSEDHDHGYAVTDYRGIEAAYGSLADLDELLAEAHARGIGVILDYVMNHSAAAHPLFVNSSSSTSAPYRDWYVWSASKPSGWSIYGNDPWHPGTGGYYFAGFWDRMPDFNLRHAPVLEFHRDNLRFWLNRGVDGFRFDAVGNLIENGPTAWEVQPENYPLMAGMAALIGGYQHRYTVCEAPADPQGFTTACGSAFAFDINKQIVGAAMGAPSSIRAVADYFKTAPTGLATMLSNHDGFAGARAHDQLHGDAAGLRLAAASLLTLPGTPFVYYGEEFGMGAGRGLSGDPALRSPMSWTADTQRAGFTSGTPYRALAANVATHNAATAQADANSLWHTYRALIQLRSSTDALAFGSYEQATVQGNALSFVRRSGSSRVVVALNYGAASASVAVSGLPAGASLQTLWPAGTPTAAADGNGTASIALGARSAVVYGY
jgi:alpha-amylase